MEIKPKFEMPVMEIVLFDNEDVITGSNDQPASRTDMGPFIAYK